MLYCFKLLWDLRFMDTATIIKKNSMQNTAGPVEPRGQGGRRQVTPQDVGHVLSKICSIERTWIIDCPSRFSDLPPPVKRIIWSVIFHEYVFSFSHLYWGTTIRISTLSRENLLSFLHTTVWLCNIKNTTVILAVFYMFYITYVCPLVVIKKLLGIL